MKKTLEQVKKDFKRLQTEEAARKMGVEVVDQDKFSRHQRTLTLAVLFLVVLVFTFELLYIYHQGRYDRAVANCYSYFRNLQGSQVLEICKAVFK